MAKAGQSVPKTLEPMEAQSVDLLPIGPAWRYEPKWDGFRCLAFRDGSRVELMSKAGKPLTRYFPEVVALLSSLNAPRFVLDGELVVPHGKELSFEDLLQRIHPAESRVKRLAEESPATLIAFDLLGGDKGALTDRSFDERRKALEAFAKKVFPRGKAARLKLSPITRSVATVKKWFLAVGAGMDGVMAKRGDLPYQSGDRTGMQKLKQKRTADCVVGGFRYGSGSKLVGSLLLGLYDDAGKLDHVGFTSGIKAVEKKALTARLEKLVAPPGFTGNAPGGPSRWSTERSAEWQPLSPTLVVEVEFDHVSGGRFRHGTGFVRWRPDKAPKQCTCEQLGGAKASALALL